MCTPTKRILYLSECWVGKTQDYGMFQREFPPGQPWFTKLRVRLDLGFVGFDKDYKCKELLIPHKKPKQQELTPEQKAENKVLAGERIVVEHSIAGLKRYRILSDRLRLHDIDLYNQVLGICAGLWNFKLTC
jgi:DDE superfamily endonuclease